MHSELDLIQADVPPSSTPPQTTAAHSSDCWACSTARRWPISFAV